MATNTLRQAEHTEKSPLFDAQRWGLPDEAVADLASRLRRVWYRFRECFTTKTRDTSEYAFTYLRGLLTMDTERNYANIARRVIDPKDDGQNIQQFMSSIIHVLSVFVQEPGVLGVGYLIHVHVEGVQVD